ncbi:MAG: hypothetical protein ACRDIU_04135 [Actinomycetota bacterium]
MRQRIFLLAVVSAVALWFSPAAAYAHGDEPHDEPSPTFSQLPFKPPADAKPPGERNPVLGIAVVGAIILAGGAGLYVYRGIRKGL